MTSAALANLDAQVRYAELLAKSTLVPKHLRGNAANVLLYLALAEAHDVPVAVAFRGMTVVGDTPAMAPEMMRAQILRKGHKIEVLKDTERECALRGTRADTGVSYDVSFTWDDATKAGLTGKSTWKQYPKAMLLARATSALGRMGFADCLNGVSYVPEELGADVDEEGNPIGGPKPADPVAPETAAGAQGGSESGGDAGSSPAPTPPPDTEQAQVIALKREVVDIRKTSGLGADPKLIAEHFTEVTGMDKAAMQTRAGLEIYLAKLREDVAGSGSDEAAAS